MTFRSRRLWLVVAGLAALVAVFHSTLLSAFGSFLVNAEPPGKADIAVVLAGDGYGDRILKAGGLIRQGYVSRALVSGPPGWYGHWECDLAIPFAVKAGFPESYFLHAENNATSTAEEARAILPHLRRHGAKTVMLVTSDYHTRRSGRVFRAAAPDIRFLVVAAPGLEFSPDGWWRKRQGRKVALLEWLKTVAEWMGV